MDENKAVKSSLSQQIDGLREAIQTGWAWPSPGSGLALLILNCLPENSPTIMPQPLNLVAESVASRLSQAPVLAGVGYSLAISNSALSDGSLQAAWKKGFERLSRRDPFPPDQESFVFRPFELLGITFGILHCQATETYEGQWLRSVVAQTEQKLGHTQVFRALLGAWAADLLGRPWKRIHPPPLQHLSEIDIALLHFILSEYPHLIEEPYLAVERMAAELIHRLTLRPIVESDPARAALLYRTLLYGVAFTLRPSSVLPAKTDKRHTDQTQAIITKMDKGQDITQDTTIPLRLLHLSDLHFTGDVTPATKLQWLVNDIARNMKITGLDYLVVSGDFTDKGQPKGFTKALEFLDLLTKEFYLTAERCILVPGNHDVIDEEAFELTRKKPSSEDDFVQEGQMFALRSPSVYGNRFKAFSEDLYHKFLQKPYPLDSTEQGMATIFPETGLQFITLNSNWQIDSYRRKQSGVCPDAVAHATRQADEQIKTFGMEGKKLLRIAVWHHAITGPEQMQNTEFLGNLQTSGVKLCLHGDIHQMERNQIGYWNEARKLHIVGSGSFASPQEGRPESTPRLYNLIEISRDLTMAKVNTREQRTPNGAWQGWSEWPASDDPANESRVPYYKIRWTL